MYLPGPLRAAVGIVASAADEAKNLPDRAIELPMLAVSTALQMSLRAQQRYARLTARGDEVLNRRHTGDEPPEWATFDDPVSADELRRTASTNGVGPTRAAAQLLEEIFGTDEPDGQDVPKAAPKQISGTKWPANASAAAKKTTTKKTAKKTSAKKASAQKSPTKKAAAKKGAAEQTGAKKPVAAARKSSGKTVSKPRHTAPSRFDDVGD